MQVWIESDSQAFNIWTKPNPYGVEVDISTELVMEHEALEKRLGEVRRQIQAEYDRKQ